MHVSTNGLSTTTNIEKTIEKREDKISGLETAADALKWVGQFFTYSVYSDHQPQKGRSRFHQVNKL